MSYKADIIRLRDEGKSYREIEKILGCSRGTISYYLGNKEAVKMTEEVKTSNPIQDKARTYAENIRMRKPCQGCSQYLHFVQLEYVSIPDLDKAIADIKDQDDFDAFKKVVTNSYVLCANCNKLRIYKEANGPKKKTKA
jgi:hypothetical protein